MGWRLYPLTRQGVWTNQNFSMDFDDSCEQAGFGLAKAQFCCEVQTLRNLLAKKLSSKNYWKNTPELQNVAINTLSQDERNWFQYDFTHMKTHNRQAYPKVKTTAMLIAEVYCNLHLADKEIGHQDNKINWSSDWLTALELSQTLTSCIICC